MQRFSKSLAILWMGAFFAGQDAFPASAAEAASLERSGRASLETFVKADGAGVFALTLSPNVAAPASPPHQLAVIFDTSASQTGVYREKALAVLETLLRELAQEDRVALLAVDVTAVPLTTGFVLPTSDEMRLAIQRLRERVPLGATDMEAALDTAADLQAANDAAGRVGRVAYIGDGMSPVQLITSTRMRQLAERFVKLQTPVISYAIGPQVDLQLLGAAAKHTGGMLLLDDDEPTGRRSGSALADCVRGVVFWPTKLELPSALQGVYFRGVPPLRFDRDTVVLGSYDPTKLNPKQSLHVRVDGELLNKPIVLDWSVMPSAPSDDNAYLGKLVEFAERDGGLSLPSLGSMGLADLRWLINADARRLAALGQQALATGNLPQAEQLADEVAKLDPKNPTASIIHTAVHKARRGSTAADAQPLNLASAAEPAATEPDDGELLDEVEQQQRVYEQFLHSQVRYVVNQARSLMAADPEQAISMLKLTLEKVTQAPEIGPELRAQMQDQIEAALQAASTQALVKEERDLRQEQVAAEGKARERINRELFLQEQKVDQLMARFNALMDEERYRDAEAVANIAEELSPATPGLRTAELTARMVGYTADMMAVVDARHKGVIDSMYQIELSHIPTPDEPPILYPDPEVWQLLTERRKKYKAVDLTENKPSEAKIVAALDDKTEIEFVDQPLIDVVEYLKERHGIEIQLDNRALTDAGLGSDTPVTRNLKGISLRSALRLMLGEMDLTYVIRNEVLMITSKTEAENMLTTKVYPVADLVIPIPAPRMGRMGGMGGGMGGMGMGGMRMGGMGMGF